MGKSEHEGETLSVDSTMATITAKDGNAAWQDDQVSMVFLTGNDTDEQDLLAQGKSQQFSRTFNFWSMLGFALVQMSTWEAILLSNAAVMVNGGPPVLIYAFIISWLGSLAVASSLAELTSMAPVSAGQYHWVWMLAPKRHKKFLSWITGWIVTLGWAANTASALFFSGSTIQALIFLTVPSYAPAPLASRCHATLLMLAAGAVCVVVNIFLVRHLPRLSHFMFALHITAFIAIITAMVSTSEHASADDVFVKFIADAGWHDNGVSFLLSLCVTNLAMLGYDSPVHLVEEMKDATMQAPRAIVWSIIVNGALGLAFCIAFAFCSTDVMAALNDPSGLNYAYVLDRSIGPRGTIAVIAIMVVMAILTGVAYLATAARQTRAFARDDGLPGSAWLKPLNSSINKIQAPLRGVVACSVITALILLVNIPSTAALGAIISLTVAAFAFSYLVPILLLSWSRMKREQRTWGRWTMTLFGYHVPGLGLFTNVVAILFLIVSMAFSFVPTFAPVTVDSMNWSCVVFVGSVLMGMVYWIWAGSEAYRGVVHEKDVFAVPYAV